MRPDRLGALCTARGWDEFGLRYISMQVKPVFGPHLQRIGELNLALLTAGWAVWMTIGAGPALGMARDPKDVARVNWLLEREAMAKGRQPR